MRFCVEIQGPGPWVWPPAIRRSCASTSIWVRLPSLVQSQVTKGTRHGRFVAPGFTPLKLKH